MSVVSIRAALETAVNNMTPALATAWENSAFAPPAATVPFQEVHVLFAKPDNQEFGSRHQEIGFMQIKLQYPIQIGTSTVAARAELIRTTFKRGSSFTSGGIVTSVTDTPEVTPGTVEGDRFIVAIKVPFTAFIN